MASALARRFGLVALIFTAAISLASQVGDDRPDSVSSNQWVKLGDRAGIVITSQPTRVGGKAGDARGELWIKLDGKWAPVTLEQPHQLAPAR